MKSDKEPEIKETPKKLETLPVKNPEESKLPSRKTIKYDEVDRVYVTKLNSCV